MTGRSTRARILVEEHFVAVITCLVVLVILGGYLTYTTHLDAGTQVETRTVARWESAGEFDHEATVREGNDVFREGHVLRNREAYFREISPVLNGSFTYTYDTSSDGVVNSVTSIVLVQRSVSDGEDDESEFWQIEHELGAGRVESLEPGERYRVPFSANVTEASNRVAELDDELGGTPGNKEVALEARVEVTGSINGESIDRSDTYRLPITFDGGVYRVNDPGRMTDTDEQRRQVVVPTHHGRVRQIGAPLVLASSLLVLVGLVIARARGSLAVSRFERDRAAYRRDRHEYCDWITTGRVPGEVLDDRSVVVDSLEGLVDVAIDRNDRVLEDRHGHRFVVPGDAVSYVYYPPNVDATDEIDETRESERDDPTQSWERTVCGPVDDDHVADTKPSEPVSVNEGRDRDGETGDE